MDDFTITAKSIREDIIPMVQEKPVKSLGKYYRTDLNDKQSVKEIQVETWMTSLENSSLPGLGTPTWGASQTSLATARLRGTSRSFCFICLYSIGSKLQLPVTSVVEEYKATKTRQAMML
ncbi:hypothetical protein N1851_013924 [Merluccius polli]|uniref:Uncharacterized protein n=1 Tax=Merluccius polli TaxID=89951 RepID=A0AA47P1A1_MERPO|nr:hypothetical protein N1851_013924 [Merluccius polli]